MTRLRTTRKHRGPHSRPVAAAIVALAAATAATTAFMVGPARAPRARAATATALRDSRPWAVRAQAVAEPPAKAAIQENSRAWTLPSVDKDVAEFIQGRARDYAYVQTSETMYVFAPYPGGDPALPPQVTLSVKDEGTNINLVVEGKTLLSGRMSHAVKPGTDIWMIEQGPDGMEFVVVEMDKVVPGREWTSLMKPQVTFTGDYKEATYSYPIVAEADQEATMEETLGHLQRQFASLVDVEPGHAAENGDALTVDIEGFQMAKDGSRGAPLDMGAAKGMRFELGNTGAGGLMPEIHESLVGMTRGETRDVPVTLGQRGGAMGGQQILVAVTANYIQKQELPELNDDFAKEVKKAEQAQQANTEAGVPWEEQGLAETFTMEQLRAEILREIRMQAEKEGQAAVNAQLKEAIFKSAQVECEWADLSLGSDKSQDQLVQEEEQAAVIEALLAREGLTQNVDLDKVEKTTWDVLGTPKGGETIAEVGKDPAREFQAARRKIIRKFRMDAALGWLEEVAEVVAASPQA